MGKLTLVCLFFVIAFSTIELTTVLPTKHIV